jgi:hypothetical protein
MYRDHDLRPSVGIMFGVALGAVMWALLIFGLLSWLD